MARETAYQYAMRKVKEEGMVEMLPGKEYDVFLDKTGYMASQALASFVAVKKRWGLPWWIPRFIAIRVSNALLITMADMIFHGPLYEKVSTKMLEDYE